jgi:hypothetical protein
VGIWFREPTADAGATEFFRGTVNRLAGRRSVGGRLLVTDRRAQFLPNRLDTLTGGKQWSVDPSQITAVKKRSGGPTGVKNQGSLAAARAQVVVTTQDSEVVLTSRDPDELERALTRLSTQS